MFHVEPHPDLLHIDTCDFSVSGEEFQIYSNSQGSLLYTYPQPDSMEQYYLSSDYDSHKDVGVGIMGKLYQIAKRFSLRVKLNWVSRYSEISSGQLLDIGAGTGEFMKAAQERGWRSKGVEPATAARELALEKGLTVYNSWEHISENNYDVITLWHVLEHLPDTDRYVKMLKRFIKPGGVIFIAVPNFKSKDAEIYGRFWAAYDVPRHLYHFSRDAILEIFQPQGFDLIATKPLWLDAYYIALLSEKYKRGKPNYLRAFLNGTFSNLLAMKNGEFSSLTYVLKAK